jgi:hypothetical integral membrane protein (TIGR02206 family)
MIKEFFVDDIVGIPFKIFDVTHLSLLTILIFGLYLLYTNREKLSNMDPSIKRNISLILISIMFINMTIYYSKLVYYQDYTWKVHLPFHFCFISGYLYMYSVLFEKKDIYKIIYFFAFMGPLPAVVFPDLRSSFDAFIFYQYFISHHFFILASMFTFYAYKIEITNKDALKSYLSAILIFISMFFFNNVFGTNYIMQRQLPDHIIRLFPFLTRINNPILLLFVSGTLIFTLAYIPIYYNNKNSLHSNEILL